MTLPPPLLTLDGPQPLAPARLVLDHDLTPLAVDQRVGLQAVEFHAPGRGRHGASTPCGERAVKGEDAR